jgi:DNA repair photolyase
MIYYCEMPISEIKAKSILRKHRKIDSWFVSRYGMNLYRGCLHNCVYCDGRAEKYNVEGIFGEDVAVKVNAVEVLNRELDPRRKRIPMKKGYILLGGGVGDSYQPVEKKYGMSGKILKLIYDYDFPVHILTKSILVKKDLDILQKINKKNRALVSFSFSSADEKMSSLFEPGVSSPAERFKAISFFKNHGISCGMYFLPVIPFLTDTPEKIEETVSKAKESGIDFIIFGGMTLKEGRQQDHFFKVLEKKFPSLIPEYKQIYRGGQWGEASGDYYHSICRTFDVIAQKYKIPQRIPSYFFKDILEENDLVVVLLEHIDHYLKSRGEKSPYGYGAYSVSQIKEPLSSIKHELTKLKGVGPVTEKIIREILRTGDSTYLRKLVNT